ncbi:hypothetical protein SDC9_170845 [bioreactor metagenome]|uniref:Uncharacterized protein n=1 Tax=bioreactor metagenome TaxID=1076179 RepID=A0A645G975_9ZZZZ
MPCQVCFALNEKPLTTGIGIIIVTVNFVNLNLAVKCNLKGNSHILAVINIGTFDGNIRKDCGVYVLHGIRTQVKRGIVILNIAADGRKEVVIESVRYIFREGTTSRHRNHSIQFCII